MSGLVYLCVVTAIFCNSIAQTSHSTYAAPNEPEAITQIEYTLHPFEYLIHGSDTLRGPNRTMICYNRSMVNQEHILNKQSWHSRLEWKKSSLANIGGTTASCESNTSRILNFRLSFSFKPLLSIHQGAYDIHETEIINFIPVNTTSKETDMHCSDTTNHELLEPQWLICKHD